MYTWIFKKVGWKFFAAGAATAVVGARYVRPAAVSVVKAGLNVSDAATSTWNQAKSESSKIMAEASSLRTAGTDGKDLLAEIHRLRDDIASVKAELANRPSA